MIARVKYGVTCQQSALMTTSNPILKSGRVLVHRKFKSHSPKDAVLVNLNSSHDLHLVASKFTQFESPTPESISLIGRLSFGLLNHSPILIISKHKFYYLSTIVSFFDEHELESACTFLLRFNSTDVRLSCVSSIDYQEWCFAFKTALHIMHSSVYRNSFSGIPLAIPLSTTDSRQSNHSPQSNENPQQLQQYNIPKFDQDEIRFGSEHIMRHGFENSFPTINSTRMSFDRD